MIAGTCPPCVSSGLGVTVKLSADNGPNLEHELMASNAITERELIKRFRIIKKIRKCRERDSNPYSHYWPRDFKSLVSTNSTIAATV